MRSQRRPTAPGYFSKTVSDRNIGETAFQRALYSQPKINLVRSRQSTRLTWKDIELPIILSTKSRRRCIDLVGHTSRHGTFLCELKYAKLGAPPPGSMTDYAIFEALLYYAIVNRDYADLDENKVYHQPEPPRFNWEAVAGSRVVLVLANDCFWITARHNRNNERIVNLVAEVRESLNIDILLCSTPDYTFCQPGSVRNGRYEPQLAPCSEEIPGAAETFPTYRAIATFD
jgi:hypothetical protein